MPYLFAAVAILFVLVGLDLVLTFGVIRRLREHEARLSSSTTAPDALPPVGSKVGDFTARTVDGEPVARELLSDDTVVGFFTPDCAPCKERLPDFVRYVERTPAQRVLAVVIGSPATTREMTEALSSVARVVVEDHDGPVAAAFGVGAFPAMGVVDGSGTITSDRLPIREAAAV